MNMAVFTVLMAAAASFSPTIFTHSYWPWLIFTLLNLPCVISRQKWQGRLDFFRPLPASPRGCRRAESTQHGPPVDGVHIPAGEEIRRRSTLHRPIKLAPSDQMPHKRRCCTSRWLRHAAGPSTTAPARCTSATAARADGRAVLPAPQPLH